MGVGVGVAVGVGEGVTVGFGVGVGVGDAEAADDGFAVGVGAADSEGVALGVAVGEKLSLGTILGEGDTVITALTSAAGDSEIVESLSILDSETIASLLSMGDVGSIFVVGTVKRAKTAKTIVPIFFIFTFIKLVIKFCHGAIGTTSIATINATILEKLGKLPNPYNKNSMVTIHSKTVLIIDQIDFIPSLLIGKFSGSSISAVSLTAVTRYLMVSNNQPKPKRPKVHRYKIPIFLFPSLNL